MDGDRFDSLVELLTHSRSRRGALGGLLGGVLTSLLGREVAAKRTGHGHSAHAKKLKSQQVIANAVKCRPEGRRCDQRHSCCDDLGCVAGRCITCPPGAVVFNGACCTPTTCEEQNKNCGAIADTCGGQIESCGDCTLPEVCGGGGTPNVCGEPPVTCGSGGTCPAGADCINNVCSCRHNLCPTGDSGLCAHGEICNPAGSSLRCCCSPTGNIQVPCAPGPNAICCSGFCGADSVCADPL